MKLEILIVGVSGFFGSIARFLIYLWMNPRNSTSFPFATLLINLSGCFLIGIMGGLVERAVPFHRHFFLIGSVGFLGAFTTFSAFGYETFALLRAEQSLLAGANIAANVVLGLLVVWVGRSLW